MGGTVAAMARAPFILTLAGVAAAAQLGCGSGDRPSGPKPTPASDARASSSIAEGAQLTDAVRWEARVSDVARGRVLAVRFLVDGKLRQVARKPPYLFAGLGNLLLPGTLGAGTHTFAVDAEVAGGPRLTTASTATVSDKAHGVPRRLVGRWTRIVARPDVRRTEGFRHAQDGVPLPLGVWTVQIGADSAARYLDPTSAHDVTVGQVRFERGGLLVVGNEIPDLTGASGGYFCPDTVGSGRYRWSLQRTALVVRALDDRECANRNSFWNGRFTP